MKTIFMCMLIDPYFALLAMGQFISYAGFLYVTIKMYRRLFR